MSEINKRFLTYADLGLKPPSKKEPKEKVEEPMELRIRLKQHKGVLGPDEVAPQQRECPVGDLGSLMMPGWAMPNKAVVPPREVPRGRIIGDDLTEAFMPTVGKAEWQEEKHPRDQGGRFSSSPGGAPSSEPPVTAGAGEAQPEDEIQDMLYDLEDVDEFVKHAKEKIDDAFRSYENRDQDAPPRMARAEMSKIHAVFEEGMDSLREGIEYIRSVADKMMGRANEATKAKIKAVKDKVQGVEDEMDHYPHPEDGEKGAEAVEEAAKALREILEGK